MTQSKTEGKISPRAEMIIQIICAYLSALVGGYGFLAVTKAWQSFPLIIIALILWHIHCHGLPRYSKDVK